MALTPRRLGRRPAAALAATVALLVVPGCSLLRSVTGVGFQRPTLAYESWSADQLDLDGVTIALHYRLENPNDFSLGLRRLDYRLEVEGRQVAEGELPAGIELRPQGATPVVFPVRLRWRDVPDFVQLLLTRSEVAYRITGSAGVGSPLGTVSLPFEHRDRVALPRPPSVRLEGMTIRELSLARLSVELRLRIENGNAFPLPVGALTYGLRLGESELVSGGTHPLVAVPPGGHATVSVPIRVSLPGVAATAGDLLRGTVLRLQGLCGYGDLQVPFDAEEQVGGR